MFKCVCVYVLRYYISFEQIELEAKSEVEVEYHEIKLEHTVAEKMLQKINLVAFKKRY